MPRSRYVRFGLALIASALLFACAKDGSDSTTDDGTTAVATPASDPDASEPTQYPTYDSGPADAGAAQDTGAAQPPVDSGSSQPANDSGSTQPQDSGSPQPQDSGSTPTNVACDLSSALKIAYYQVELTQISNPQPCPCNAGECCYLAVCVPQ